MDEHVLEQLNGKLDPYIATMVMVLQECGISISELCTLKKGNVITDKEVDCILKYYQWKMKKKDIRNRIETLRGMQIREVIPRKKIKSPRSEDVLISTLKSCIKALEDENKQLKDQVQKLKNQVQKIYRKLF